MDVIHGDPYLDGQMNDLHELSLDHGSGLVIVRVAGSQQRVDLVDEDDAGLDLPGQGEHRRRQLLALPVPGPLVNGEMVI